MVEFVMGYRFALYVGRFALLVVRTALQVPRDVHHAGPYQVMAGYFDRYLVVASLPPLFQGKRKLFVCGVVLVGLGRIRGVRLWFLLQTGQAQFGWRFESFSTY